MYNDNICEKIESKRFQRLTDFQIVVNITLVHRTHQKIVEIVTQCVIM
jgi:hypothetical protein